MPFRPGPLFHAAEALIARGDCHTELEFWFDSVLIRWTPDRSLAVFGDSPWRRYVSLGIEDLDTLELYQDRVGLQLLINSHPTEVIRSTLSAMTLPQPAPPCDYSAVVDCLSMHVPYQDTYWQMALEFKLRLAGIYVVKE